jgi:F-type H+-transporting ATPase subunit a
MNRIVVALALTLGLSAWAEGGEEPFPAEAVHSGESSAKAPVEKRQDTASAIMEHVSDGDEIEFENPFSGFGGPESFTLKFPVWRVALHDGACPASPEEEASLAAGCLDLSITKHSFMILLASALLVVVLLMFSHRKSKELVPRGTSANIIELLVLFVRDEIAVVNIGKDEGPRYTPYLLTIFFFILAINLLGLFPFMATATGNLAVTGGLAVCTFLVTQYASFRSAGFVGYFKHLTGGAPLWMAPLMVPIEIIGLFTKPFALTLRLFANMLAGHIVLFSFLGLIFILHHWAVAALSVPMAVALYLLEIFVAFLQAYVFTMLSAVFIGMGVAMGHHEEHHDEHAAHH